MAFPGGSSGKEPACTGDLRDVGLIPGSGRSSGGAVNHSKIYWPFFQPLLCGLTVWYRLRQTPVLVYPGFSGNCRKLDGYETVDHDCLMSEAAARMLLTRI